MVKVLVLPRPRPARGILRVGIKKKTKRYKDTDALYPFKSRGFGGEIGLVTANTSLAISLLHYSLIAYPTRKESAPLSVPTLVVIRIVSGFPPWPGNSQMKV